ncbi:uncharacterized protein BJ212DRAFT_1449924 [Suillus subaureus]|uniref:CxC1-like cysteine cluster associated with KDZ transposases domain-containing protein n=1 Tax=Suillus subaureus TaxID=48587 RepID=A0A9P7DU38_9AGAM|nr:uncharacterized protein BJ212DRAFT_1449924 [Suillus subaureus]KAG1803292.1 hypothetical protein BJ212DRAFT_1449924 [Suillus subaureus]
MDPQILLVTPYFFNDPSVHHLTSSQKKTNQWCRWSEEVILLLIVPYLAYMQETSMLHYANMVQQPHGDTVACHAGCGTCSIKVACVFFDSLSEINIIACPCFPAPLQLLRHGLFPCAPVAPSLAVDLHVLEFVHLLFIRQSPNHTAWCNAVEMFLDGMGYKLTLMHSLCHHFSNAFHWYQVLTILARDHISNLIADTWKDKICLQPMAVKQPTEYLYIIICIDACFTQKCSTNPHGANGHNPPNLTPSFFLPKDDVQAMDEFMQCCQGERHRERVSRMEPEEDCYEMGMSVPVSVLDGCLMALLCRHDCVLWIMNLTSVGEKQHYLLALLDHLFKHLPPQMTIGLLYDIRCQLEQSCHKWSLLDESILSQITFAVAVFHTYGHQWPCQIIYHPRKHKATHPPLRVSGFNQHLFVLDTQICHLDMRSLQGFGHWLHWHWIHCQMKKNAALDNLQDLDLNKDMLCVEWKAQIVHQTRPAAAKVITTLLALEKTLDAHDTSVHELEAWLHGGHVDDMVKLNLQLIDARLRCTKVTNTIRHHRSALGVEDKAELEKMKKDVYLTARLNARTVKTRIQDRLRQRKFKLERLERSYRASINAEKLHANTQHSIKRHKPGILKLVSTYNGLAPPFAIPPHSILHDGIFQLDVDDNIWQDIGLDNATVNPPVWLSDEAIRNGIQLQLEVDHCFKEEAQLMRKWSVMQEWMLMEWEGIQDALSNADELANICVVWRRKVQCIPCAWSVVDSWGPSDEVLLQATHEQVQPSFQDEDDQSVGPVEEDNEGDSDCDIALVDEYRYDIDPDDDLDDIEDDFMPSSPTRCPTR